MNREAYHAMRRRLYDLRRIIDAETRGPAYSGEQVMAALREYMALRPKLPRDVPKLRERLYLQAVIRRRYLVNSEKRFINFCHLHGLEFLQPTNKKRMRLFLTPLQIQRTPLP